MRLKALLASFAVALFVCGMAQADEPTYSTYSIKKNAGGDRIVPVRVLKQVRFSSQNQNGPDVAVGNVLVYDTNSNDGVSVRLTTTSGDAAIAGIAATIIQTADNTQPALADSNARRNWGWIVVHGPATATVDGAGGASAGNPWMASADSGEVMTPVLGTGGNYDNAARRQRLGGFFMGTPADGEADVFVQLE